MTENFGWAVDFVLGLQSINLLVRVAHSPKIVKKRDTLGVEKWSTNSLRHKTIADFLKKSLVKENKTQKFEKSATYEREHWPFSAKEAEWTERNFYRNTFPFEKPIMQHVFSFD